MTTREGGASAPPYDTFNLGDHVGDDEAAVLANRRRLAEALGRPGLAWMRQVHGNDVSVVGSERSFDLPACDALVTSTPSTALVVLVADCVPVLLADPVAGVVGAAHAGREGVRQHVVTRTVEAMVSLGAQLGDLDVLLGPAICGRCYEVSAEIADQVESAAPGGAVLSWTGAPALDLRAALRMELSRLGAARVVSDPRCTAEDRTMFSYRRDGVTGRQAGVAWLP